MEHRRVCFCMLSLLPLVQISELSQANSLLFGKVCCRTPSRGAWIEILAVGAEIIRAKSHPSRGAWIEMKPSRRIQTSWSGRTPRGVRGLK